MAPLCRTAPARLDFLCATLQLSQGTWRRRRSFWKTIGDAASLADCDTPHHLPSGDCACKLAAFAERIFLRKHYSDVLPPELDAGRFPQRPLILGDKWDF
jgi:hypothetical protein